MLPNFTTSTIKDTSSIPHSNKPSGLIHKFLNSRTDGIRIGLSAEYNATGDSSPYQISMAIPVQYNSHIDIKSLTRRVKYPYNILQDVILVEKRDPSVTGPAFHPILE